jgi:hypothetical protein
MALWKRRMMVVVTRKTAGIVHLQGGRQADRPVEMFRNAILSSESPRNHQLSSAISVKPHLHRSYNLHAFTISLTPLHQQSYCETIKSSHYGTF